MVKGNYDRDDILIEIIRQMCLYGSFTFADIKKKFPKLTNAQFHRITAKLRDKGLLIKNGKTYEATEQFAKLFNITEW